MKKLLEQYKNKKVVPTGHYYGIRPQVSQVEYSSSEEEGDVEETAYEQDFVQAELEKYAQKIKENEINDLYDIEDVDTQNLNAWSAYEQYNFETKFINTELPIHSYKKKIIGLLNINNVVVLHGPTGCGKTTQVPQFILDHSYNSDEMCNIAVTQPRKIATINVARRVCEERAWTLGSICGYQVGLERQTSNETILTFMTTGVLLQKIVQAKSLSQYTHIIIDEIHERTHELDFLLVLVRKFLFTNSPNTKVILMSATIEAEVFAHYFRTQNVLSNLLAPVLHMNKQSEFTKHVYYADQLKLSSLPTYDFNKPEISLGMWQMFEFLVDAFDSLDTVDTSTNQKIVGSILVFLPGLREIEEAHSILLSIQRPSSAIQWNIVPLHSSLPNVEQRKAFEKQQKGYRKIILSTNIAESSITVPDSTYVIDFCLTKVLDVDPTTCFSSLRLEWAAHVNCDQRAGRVGRVSNGRVYRLVTQEFYQHQMSKFPIPEILRAPLDRVVLLTKQLDLNETPKQILALALSPPNLKKIESTIWNLKEVGGLLMTCRGEMSASDGDLTFLGTVMAALPLDIQLSKFIILGHMFGYLNDAIIIAAGCSVQKIFSVPFQKKFEAYKHVTLFSDSSDSDLITFLNLHEIWIMMKRQRGFENAKSEQHWCEMNSVSMKGLQEWNILINEITERLKNINIFEANIKKDKKAEEAEKAEKALILKIITAGAFYPNYFIKSSEDVVFEERKAVQAVNGRDPWRTVYFTGMDLSQPKQLYAKEVKKMMLGPGDSDDSIQIGFDDSAKVYVEFKRRPEPIHKDHQFIASDCDKIPIAVYEAVRKRQLNVKFPLNLLPINEAWMWAEKLGAKAESDQKILIQTQTCIAPVIGCQIPSLDKEYIKIIITARINAVRFWAQHFNEDTNELLTNFEIVLNQQVLHPVEKDGEVVTLSLSDFYAAKFNVNGKFYRCQVISYSNLSASIRFIDYGNIQKVKITDLYKLPPQPLFKAPALAIECVLSHVKPCPESGSENIWSETVAKLFIRRTENVILHGKVFSVVNDVVHLELFRKHPLGQYNENNISLNQWLVESGNAVACEESYLSRFEHNKREQVQKAENPNNEAHRLSQNAALPYKEFEAPTIESGYTQIFLKGPFSPLEMTVSGCLASAINKKVVVDGNSVNTVLLDNSIQDSNSRLLVARHVGQSASANLLRLRQTSLMPNLPGFPMLMALIFCPMMEPKLTTDGSRVASILCGLGSDDFSKAFYPEHNMILQLDTDLQVEEIQMINELRYKMNRYLQLDKKNATDELKELRKNIRGQLFEIMHYHRTTVPRVRSLYEDTWKKFHTDAVILRTELDNNKSDVWPLHKFVKLQSQSRDPEILQNLEELDHIALKLIPQKITSCLLCGEKLITIFDVVTHKISPGHKQRLEEFENGVDSDDDED